MIKIDGEKTMSLLNHFNHQIQFYVNNKRGGLLIDFEKKSIIHANGSQDLNMKTAMAPTFQSPSFWFEIFTANLYVLYT